MHPELLGGGMVVVCVVDQAGRKWMLLCVICDPCGGWAVGVSSRRIPPLCRVGILQDLYSCIERLVEENYP